MNENIEPLTLLLVAGLSGAGKSTCLDTLSDAGFFAIDNLPVPLLPQFLKYSKGAARYARTALLLDIDSTAKLEKLLESLKELDPAAIRAHLVFLDARTESVIRRYSETRRPHPGFDPTRDRSLEDTIQRERSRLQPFKERAHLVIDTSDLTVHDLRREIRTMAGGFGASASRQVRVNFLSFGFKYGAPIDCDLVVDLRFLPNPYFVDTLRDKTGEDAAVSEFVLKSEHARKFLDSYGTLLNFLLPLYVHEGKSYLNIGIGCTGGRHRSVVIANELKKRIEHPDCLVSVKHRDVLR